MIINHEISKAKNILGIATLPIGISALTKIFRNLIKINHPDNYFNEPLKRESAEECTKQILDAHKIILDAPGVVVDDRHIDQQKVQTFECFTVEVQKNPNKLYVPCTTCHGDKIVKYETSYTQTACPHCSSSMKCVDCHGTGIFMGGVKKEKSCPACQGSGDFVLRSGRVVPCKNCDGTGVYQVKFYKPKMCFTCHGIGDREVLHTPSSNRAFRINGLGKKPMCPTCNDSGKVRKKSAIICPNCNGLGEVVHEQWNPVIKFGAILK